MIGLSLGLGLSSSVLSTLGQVLALLDAANTDGAYYDPSDLTSLFQDSKGTTQVASDGDVVGFMLDKAQFGGKTAAGFIAGADEVSSNAGNTFTATTGYVAYATSGTVPTLSVVSGNLRVANAGSTNHGKAVIPLTGLTVGRYYHVSIGGASGTGTSYCRVTTSSTGLASGSVLEMDANNGDYDAFFAASATTMYLSLGNDGAGSTYVEFTAASVKEVPGFHMVQSTTAAKPLYKTSGGLHWLDADGVNDLMLATPGLDLGETWSHVGGWRVDAGGDALFALSDVSAKSGPYSQSTAANGLEWQNAGDTARDEVLAGDPTTAFIMSMAEASGSINSRYNGASDTTLAVYDDSAGTQGLALFTGITTSATAALLGRFYGGIFTAQALSDSDLVLCETLIDQNVGVL